MLSISLLVMKFQLSKEKWKLKGHDIEFGGSGWELTSNMTEKCSILLAEMPSTLIWKFKGKKKSHFKWVHNK